MWERSGSVVAFSTQDRGVARFEGLWVHQASPVSLPCLLEALIIA